MSPENDEKAKRALTGGLQKGSVETKLDLRSSDEEGEGKLGRKKLDRYEAKKLAAEIQRSGEVSFTGHCQEELKKDSMDTADVLNILRCGKIEREPEPESKFGIWRYRVETHRMAAVIEIHSKKSLRVITAWRK
jgi:hypothetical protein